MSIYSIITRGYGSFGTVGDIPTRGYWTGAYEMDTCEMVMTCGTFTAGTIGLSWFRKMRHRIVGWITPNTPFSERH